MDRRFWGRGAVLYTLCILYTVNSYTFFPFIHLSHFIHFINHSHKGKGKARQGQMEKGKLAQTRSKKGKGGQPPLRPNSTRQPDRAHARTARHETISQLDSPPKLRFSRKHDVESYVSYKKDCPGIKKCRHEVVEKVCPHIIFDKKCSGFPNS